jgi:crotonobetainyl-CoA:carnitine CoA-transferase CaiB-like acyl-CoA transferase
MGILKNIKVLELGHVLAVPFCGALLADFGADVIKVEMPGAGDGLRHMGPMVDDRSLWFCTENRGKKCVTLNLKAKKGKEMLTELIKNSDVILENYKPGTIAKLGFSWEEIHKINPKVILLQISGYGQTGPQSNRLGYDRIGLGVGGLTYITGEPDGEPTKPGNSMADYLAGYSAALGIMMAIHDRDLNKTGLGQKLDISLYDTVFRVSEFNALNYHLTGAVRERTGNTFVATIPGGHFLTKDAKWISLSVGNDRLFKKLCECLDREDFLERPEFATNSLRSENRKEIDDYCTKWISEHTREECLDILAGNVPIGQINSIADIFEDPQFEARKNFAYVQDDKWGEVKIQGTVPNMSRTPGEVKWLGPDLGQHNEEIYSDLLGLTSEEIKKLKEEEVI